MKCQGSCIIAIHLQDLALSMPFVHVSPPRQESPAAIARRSHYVCMADEAVTSNCGVPDVLDRLDLMFVVALNLVVDIVAEAAAAVAAVAAVAAAAAVAVAAAAVVAEDVIAGRRVTYSLPMGTARARRDERCSTDTETARRLAAPVAVLAQVSVGGGGGLEESFEGDG